MITEVKYKKWLALRQQLQKVKDEELMLRKEICVELFDGATGEFKAKRETKNLIVEATSKVTRSLDEEALRSISDNLNDEERECLKYKASLDTRKWRKLPDDSLLHEAVVEKPATPTLVVEVKV